MEHYRGIIAHVVSPYLFLTGSWIHSQLTKMRHFKPIVLTNRVENLAVFPFQPIYSYQDVSLTQKAFLRVFNRSLATGYERWLYRILRKSQALLLHCHFGDCAVEVMEVGRKLALPFVTAFYGADMSFLPQDREWREKFRLLFQVGRCFLVEGNASKRGLMALGCAEEKIVVQHLGVDVERIAFVPRSLRPDGTVHILVAGTFREKKGIPGALEAFARARQTHNNLRLTLIGDAANPARDELEKQRILTVISKYDLKESVNWVGFQPYDVFHKMLMTHDLFLSPSVTAADGDSEGGSPVSITEAQATGMPVVSTFHADIPEVVLHGESGLLSAERDIDALTANLEHMVAHPDQWETMGRRGREHVEKEYNVKVQIERLEAIYSKFVLKEIHGTTLPLSSG